MHIIHCSTRAHLGERFLQEFDDDDTPSAHGHSNNITHQDKDIRQHEGAGSQTSMHVDWSTATIELFRPLAELEFNSLLTGPIQLPSNFPDSARRPSDFDEWLSIVGENKTPQQAVVATARAESSGAPTIKVVDATKYGTNISALAKAQLVPSAKKSFLVRPERCCSDMTCIHCHA